MKSIVYTAHQLDLIGPSLYRRANIELNERDEGEQDAHEEPEILADSFALMNTSCRPYRQAVAELGLSTELFESLTGIVVPVPESERTSKRPAVTLRLVDTNSDPRDE